MSQASGERATVSEHGAGGSRIRQRQRHRLIDACISALHIYRPSRTTVEKVVALADLSPGIVRFYFDSKAAMLVASLEYLAAEFGERVLIPVERLKDTPVQALRLLGKRKGYTFLGTNSAGVNAFFVRDDYAARFEAAIQNTAVFPSRLRESMDETRRLSFRSGSARADLIEHLPVVNTETQERHTLRDLKPLYSDEWMQILDLPQPAKPAELISNANSDLA